jgi:hypothetical protein
LAVVASIFVQGLASARPGTGGIVAELPVATTTAFRATRSLVADAYPPLPVEPSVAADERHPALVEPWQLGRVVEIVDDLVAAREHAPSTSSRPVATPEPAAPRPELAGP